MKKRIFSLISAILILASLCACGSAPSASATPTSTASAEGWKPSGPVTMTLWAGAGGGTDLTCRALAASFEEQFGVPFNVVNMTGGGGGIAANYVLDKAYDGQTLFGMSEGIHTMNVLGATNFSNDCWDMMMAVTTACSIAVGKDSAYNSIEDLVSASQVKPLNVSCSTKGSIWYVKMLQIAEAAGINFNYLPYDSSNDSMVALLSNEVDVVICGLAEQSEYIKSGMMTPLAIGELEAAAIDGYGEIASIVDAVPAFAEQTQAYQWAGFAIHRDTPEEIKNAYHQAFSIALESSYMQELCETKGFDILGKYGEDAAEANKACNTVLAWTLWDQGVATVSPEEFGIER